MTNQSGGHERWTAAWEAGVLGDASEALQRELGRHAGDCERCVEMDELVMKIDAGLESARTAPGRATDAAGERAYVAVAANGQRAVVECSPAGVTKLYLNEESPRAASREIDDGEAAETAKRAREEVAEYLAGRRREFSVPVDLSALPAFQRAVLE